MTLHLNELGLIERGFKRLRNWLDVQTRALYQAEMMIKEVMK